MTGKRKSAPRKALRCIDCGAKIHRFDRYTIVAVKHRDCHDTKLAGQMRQEGLAFGEPSDPARPTISEVHGDIEV